MAPWFSRIGDGIVRRGETAHSNVLAIGVPDRIPVRRTGGEYKGIDPAAWKGGGFFFEAIRKEFGDETFITNPLG